ncbi:hypothetical protein KUH32_12305 [Thalassococcus sp. CAU 1522]|uniref:NADH dehydrogenase n=1 Tax=Thalassococcus arenae TaxID=2851652 RepID=A0ABS6N968_9RHOB|nr:hypothetical protein [Thalassococcus arenae]MBV2360561.1 hypothetical protein [Thalassococcus arenae]
MAKTWNRSGGVAAGAALVLLAGCIPPQGTTAEDLAMFDEAVISIGCNLQTEAHFQPVELQTGLPRDTVVKIANYKVSTKEAVVLEEGGFRLVTGPCTPAPAPAAPAEA